MVDETFADSRPSRTDDFANLAVDIIQAATEGDARKVEALMNIDPNLTEAEGRGPDGWSGDYRVLHMAAAGGHTRIIEKLLDRGQTLTRGVVRGRH